MITRLESRDDALRSASGPTAPHAVGAGDRFVIRGVLGAGAMGIVYRAYDRRLGGDVAMKRLRHVTGRDLYRFKREFRVLADIVHPNVVTLHELHTEGDEWFVTMELIEGVSFIDWVRPGRGDDTIPDDADVDATRPRALHRPIRSPLERARLDAALPQLIDGVLALHRCGKLHRDLKPSNVLVTHDGRVVLLDFGLVSDLDAELAAHTHDTAAIGTPSYMSPEQAADLPLTEASDWYAVGVMLYEALTGRRPFEGRTAEVLRRKQIETPPAPRSIDPDVPADLDALCTALLARAPQARPDGPKLLAALGRAPSAATVQLEQALEPRPFVGRDAELAALRDAFDASRDHAVAVLVRGESGIGKTQLVRHFVDEVAGKALVLEGRCYERESMPFKALDGVIDTVTRVLLGIDDREVRDSLPDVSALARLFPVLHRVPAIAARALTAAPQELRRRASVALRALLDWLAARQPVVIAIDDLQWGDSDSAMFLADLVHHPAPLRLLLVLVHRVEDDADVVAAIHAPHLGLAGGDVRAIALGPLCDRDARDLARAFEASEQVAEALVRDTGGHPLFLLELARGASRGGETPTFDKLIARRVADLPPAAVALLRTVVVAARPLRLLEAAHAAGLPGMGVELARLVGEHLVRLRHLRSDDVTLVEPYHDRVREAVVATIDSAGLQRIHEALTRALESGVEAGDVDALVAHCLGAGDLARAAHYAVRAAEVAESQLAFHRAAELYGLALVHGEGAAPARRLLHRKRGEALANGGRLDEAVTAFAEAARGAPDDETLELDRLRLEQLLRRGRLPEGLALAQRLLERVGIALPTERSAAIAQLTAQRERLHRRGYGFTERREADIDPARLRQVDLLTAVSMSISVADPLTGMLVQGHLMEAALDAGEPRRACLALAAELGYLGLAAVPGEIAVADVAAQTCALAARIGEPYVTGFTTAMLGLVGFLSGRWRDAREQLEAGIQAMCEHGPGARWEIDVAQVFHLGALVYLGETRELAQQVPVLLRDAMERGDVYAQHALRAWRPNLAWLVMGRPEDARAHVVAVEAERTAPETFQLGHYYELMSHAQIDLYQGDVDGAWRRIEGAWSTLVASHLLRVQSVRVEATALRARAMLAHAATTQAGERRELVDAARLLARALDGEGAPWASALAAETTAIAAAVVGDRAGAATALTSAIDQFVACDMGLHATVARLRRGQLIRGAAGEDEVTRARLAMTEQAVADPDALARVLCPWPS